MKLSFGTSCMERLHHLSETYIKNIDTALKFDDTITFVLLNYNSRDGMDRWVNENLNTYIQSGVVRYMHTTVPTEFSQSHAKNITMKHGSGEVVCNLDADNFLSEKFLRKLYSVFAKSDGPVILAGEQLEGVAGRIACRKEHLYELGGFDEYTFTGWGGEDLDFIHRFELHYNTTCVKLGFEYLEEAINTDHENQLRIHEQFWKNEKLSKQKIERGELICTKKNWGELP